MYNIVFVCYGNICRSPMAEMIFKDLIIKNNKRYLLSCISRATSVEELGNGIYPDAKKILTTHNITIEHHIAKQITKDDYEKFDYIIVMEEQNKKEVLNIIGEDKKNKVHLLLEYTNEFRNIADPWYTGDFITTYNDINNGCNALFAYLIEKRQKDE